MARKKKGIGGFIGSLAGTPYDRLGKHIEKTNANADPADLARELNKIAKVIRREYNQDHIDEEEHDLLLEEIEEIHPDEKIFPKLLADSDEFYDDDNMPDAPDLDLGGPVNLDELMRSKTGSFQGSWAAEEYDEFKRQKAEEFYKDSDEAIASGDHRQMESSQDLVAGRVFHNVEDEVHEVKKGILRDQGVDVDEDEEDEDYYVDDDKVEWWRDDEGAWWFREPGQEDWFPEG